MAGFLSSVNRQAGIAVSKKDSIDSKAAGEVGESSISVCLMISVRVSRRTCIKSERMLSFLQFYTTLASDSILISRFLLCRTRALPAESCPSLSPLLHDVPYLRAHLGSKRNVRQAAL